MRAHEFMAWLRGMADEAGWSWTNSSSAGITRGRILGKQSGPIRLDGVDTSERPTRRQSLPDASAYCAYLTRVECKTAEHSYIIDFIAFLSMPVDFLPHVIKCLPGKCLPASMRDRPPRPALLKISPFTAIVANPQKTRANAHRRMYIGKYPGQLPRPYE